MFSGGKYVVFDEQHIVIFDPAQVHAEVAKRIRGVPTSAGFIQVGLHRESETDNEPVPSVSCYGKSESLHLDSNPKLDEALARQALGMSRGWF